MISTKKQLYLLDENPRHSNLSLTNQTFVCCVNIITQANTKQTQDPFNPNNNSNQASSEALNNDPRLPPGFPPIKLTATI
jgi:hypothetical protein